MTHSSKPNEYVFKRSLDDLCHDPGTPTVDTAQMVATGRKTWKALKGKNEAVWPSYLEASLIEALERYKPDPSAGTKLVGRFPRRNRFISDYIFQHTGKRRTPKQVGSRLQQIKETCTEPYILGLLRKREFPPGVYRLDEFSLPSPVGSQPPTSPSSASEADDNSVVISPVTPSIPTGDFIPEFDSCLFDAPKGRVLLEFTPDTPWMYARCEVQSPSDISFNIISPGPHTIAHRTHGASSTPISTVDPRVVFTSSAHIKANEHYCIFHVLLGDTIIHTETALLISEPRTDGMQSYSTQLMPQYWERLRNINGLSRYTLVQEVKRVTTSTGTADATLISVDYSFAVFRPSLTASHSDSTLFRHSPLIPRIAQPQPCYRSSLFGAVEEYTWPRDVGRSCSTTQHQPHHIVDTDRVVVSDSHSMDYLIPTTIRTHYEYDEDPWLYTGQPIRVESTFINNAYSDWSQEHLYPTE